jgi:4-hydroxy-3-methylbut-2-enyl diphosphate reductase
MGMCFGVKDALAMARNIPDPERVTIYGELVHNEHVMDSLSKAGFELVSEVSRHTPSTPAVLLTAHGVSNRQRDALAAAGKQIIDTTCPLVRRAHDAALKLAGDGWHVVIAGKRGHVEVIGLSGDLDSYSIIQSAEECGPLPFQRIAVVCQTTLQPHVARAIGNALKMANPAADVRLVDTICRPTRDRQAAMANLLPQCDAIVVVGGAHSNNTQQLVNVAKEAGKPVVHVQSVQQIEPAWIAQFGTIGVTAGTSTPDELIDKVCEWVERIQPVKHQLVSHSAEVA